LLLLTNPAQWQALQADPGLIAGAVEEILRAQGTGGAASPGTPMPTLTSAA
jgi:cytochrome P450